MGNTESRRPLALKDAMNQLFNQSIWDPFGALLDESSFHLNLPRMDVSEDEESLHIEIDTPGFSAKDISVEIEGDMLFISGKTSEEKEEGNKKKKYYRKERSLRSFERSISLPSYVNTQNISCDIKDGTLSIIIPKKKELSSKKKIPIKE